MGTSMRNKTWSSLCLLICAMVCLQPIAEAEAQPSIKNDPAYIKFQGGDGQPFRGQDPTFYPALMQSIIGFPGIKFTLPDYEGKPQCFVEITGMDRLITGDPFEQLMIHSVTPTDQFNNKYVKQTANTVKILEQSVLASAGNITPAELMTMSLRATDGNFPMAALTAHNFLKEIAYGGRAQYLKLKGLIAQGKPYRFPTRYGEVAAKFVNMRTAKGDKMGIWYHSFVPLAITAWTFVPDAGDNAIIDENRARQFVNMGSPVDPEKQSSDEKFALIIHKVHKLYSLQIDKIKVCHAEVNPKSGPVGTKFKLNIAYQVPDAPSPVFLTESIEVVSDGTPGATSVNVVSKSKRTITRGERDSKRDFESSPLKAGKYTFKVALETQGFRKDLNLPFTVTAGATTGLVASAPEITYRGVTPAQVVITDSSVNIQRKMYNNDTKSYDIFTDTINYSGPPPSLVPGQKVVLKASFVIPPYVPPRADGIGPSYSAIWGIGDIFGTPMQIEQFVETNSAQGDSQADTSFVGPKSIEYNFKVRKPPSGHVPVIHFQARGKDGGVLMLWRYKPPQ